MSRKTWILYGANGYTGTLIAEEARRRNVSPVLAGRREQAIEPLARRLGFDFKIFSLESVDAVARELEGVDAVLLAAGPFSATSQTVVEACLRTGTHYLDITGEISVFEACHRRGQKARQCGCSIIPGVGFDVVPSDCLAACLKEVLPKANRLELAFHGTGGLSRGTMKTVLEGFPLGGAIRDQGKIRRVPIAWRRARISFRDRPRLAVTISWGDVSTAFHSTGIPNVIVYTSVPATIWRSRYFLRMLAPLLRLGTIQRFVKRRIDRNATGPDAMERQRGQSQLWAKVTSNSGTWVEGTVQTPQGYRLTSLTAVASIEQVLRGTTRAGFLTPTQAFGSRFIESIEGCDLQIGAIHNSATPE